MSGRNPSSRSSSERGASAVFLMLALPVMLAFAGLAVDAGQLYVAQSKLKSAVDAGALAGSLALPEDPNVTTGGKATLDARDMVYKNLPELKPTSSGGVHPVSVSAGTDIRSVCVQATMTVPFALMGVVGITSDTITAKSCAGFNNLEVVFVIDNSGSMNGTPITKVKEAATAMVNLILPDNAAPSTKVGLVPFRGKVRVPSGVDGQAEGCRNADGTLNVVHYKKDPYNSNGPWILTSNDDTCKYGMPLTQALTTTKTAILSSISKMNASSTYTSGTIISEGIKWGVNVLTPDAPFTEGGDPKKFRKVMILLTDGDNEDGSCGGSNAVSYSPNSYYNNSWHGMSHRTTYDSWDIHACKCNNSGCQDQQMIKAADAAKAAGIEVFTIRYGTSDTNDKQLMKNVASSKVGTEDHYFDAPTSNEFDDIFRKIGRQLGHRLLN